LAQIGPIDTLELLANADALVYEPIRETEAMWPLLGLGDVQQNIPIRQLRLQSDNLSMIKKATLSGMGVSGLPLYACIAELEAGTLQVVLPEWRPKAGRLAILFPSRRGLAPQVRAFVDFLKAELPDLLEPK
jgi:DNA-binding transcriptional LysR family regulator